MARYTCLPFSVSSTSLALAKSNPSTAAMPARPSSPGVSRARAAFSISWTACVGPVLASVLAIAATRETAWEGAYLLVVYSLGLGLPFLIIGIAFDFFTPLLKKIQRYAMLVRIISGILLIVIGILILTNSLSWISGLAG